VHKESHEVIRFFPHDEEASSNYSLASVSEHAESFNDRLNRLLIFFRETTAGNNEFINPDRQNMADLVSLRYLYAEARRDSCRDVEGL
jgi:hypothetical protein